MPGWFVFVGIIAGIILARIWTSKIWYQDDSPWQPPKTMTEDDPTISAHGVTVSYSKSKTSRGSALAIALIICSIIMIADYIRQPADKDIYYGYLLAANIFLFGVRLCYKKGRIFIIDPQLLLINNKGIEAAGIGFYPWPEINKLEVQDNSYYVYTNNYIIYNCPAGRIKLDITDCDTSPSEISHLVAVFQSRYEKQQNTI